MGDADQAPVLEVEGLEAGYGDHTVLKGVGLRVARGEIRIILGASGCGKSTLLKNIIGIDKPRKGRIRILGEEVDWSEDGLSPDKMRRLGVLFQGGALLSSLTVGENVALPLRIHHPDLPDAMVEDLVGMKLERVRLAQARDKLPAELSGGMRKRAGLARAMATDPDLLFCDEPSAGLDPVTSRGLDDLLLELRQDLGVSMVVVTHELESIRAICDRMTFLAGGKVIFDGTLEGAEREGPAEVKDFLARVPADGGEGGAPAAERRPAFELEE